MINVNQITAQLARMPDQALQQYASMHKDDPYTVALALSESNRRKQMRSAAQGQAGINMPPSVVDQDIAEMVEEPQSQTQPMPEDVGIGALPAPNMQNMAMGGIVAFGDGGEVPRYQAGGISAMMQATIDRNAQFDREQQEREQAEQSANMDRTSTAGDFFRGITGSVGDYIGQQRAEQAARQARLDTARVSRSNLNAARPGLFEQLTPAERGVRNAEVSRLMEVAPVPAVSAVYPDESQRSVVRSAPISASMQLPARDPSAGGISLRGRSAPAIDNASKPMDMLTQYTADRDKLRDVDPYEKETQTLGELGIAGAQERKAALSADQDKFANAYREREGRLTKREGELAQQKESNTGLAFLNAGLAIMSTPGGLATAIGKGAQVGTQQFAAGLDKIRAAQDRLEDARDKTEELKLNRAELSAREIRQADAEINTTKLDAKKLALSGLKEAGAKNDKVAGLVFEATAKAAISRDDNLTRLQAARIAATAKAGDADSKLLAQQLKVQQVLNANPEYKKNAELAAFPGKTGDAARARNKIIETEIYKKFAPELLPDTISDPSTVFTPGGTRTIDFMTGKPI